MYNAVMSNENEKMELSIRKTLFICYRVSAINQFNLMPNCLERDATFFTSPF